MCAIQCCDSNSVCYGIMMTPVVSAVRGQNVNNYVSSHNNVTSALMQIEPNRVQLKLNLNGKEIMK